MMRKPSDIDLDCWLQLSDEGQLELTRFVMIPRTGGRFFMEAIDPAPPEIRVPIRESFDHMLRAFGIRYEPPLLRFRRFRRTALRAYIEA